MIILDCEQLTDEWYAARAGIPSASNFDKLITTKGELSKQADKYIYQLAGERILGRKEESYQNAAMIRGIELEAEARDFYELTHGVQVIEAGIVYRDEEKNYSCSPDGLIATDGSLVAIDGGLEIKCPMLHTHVEYLVKGVLPPTYFQQVQGSLFITGLEWWDFVSYYPGMPVFEIRVYPDEKFHHKLQYALDFACQEIDKIESDIRSKIL